MSTNFRDSVRRSFVTKLAIYLQQSGSRDMTIPLRFSKGIANFEYGDNPSSYGIVPREIGEELFYPGVNITFLDETDASVGRSRKKRYILPVKITITKAIEGNMSPSVAAVEVRGVMQLVLEALADGHVDIWDYSSTPAIYTGAHGSFHEVGYKINDESLAHAGGDIRHSLTLFINYADTSF